MTFKKIQFKNADAQRIYENYLKQIQSATKTISKEDQQEIQMELNSHIYESFTSSHIENPNDEVAVLLNVLEKIGIPSEILKPLVADRKLKQATKTFNPIHVFQALFLNLSFGIIYILFFILYLLLFAFSILILAKMIFPENTGFFYQKGEIFVYGITHNESILKYEVLGYWFIPITLVITVIFYFIITLLLKLKRNIKK